jgi:hypothetical protein
MSDALLQLQAAALAVIEAHPVLGNILTGVFDGPPPLAEYPYLSIGGGLSSDWSTKTAIGREIRLAVTLWDNGEQPTRLQQLAGHVEDAMSALPRELPGWRIASCVFLRQLASRDPVAPMAVLVEYRVRMLAV